MGNQIILPFRDELNDNIQIDNYHEGISQLLEEWGNLKIQLENLYKQRDQRNTLHRMKKGITLYLQFLFWSNDKEVNLKEPVSFNEIEIKPVNVNERLGFIVARPNLFHSYRQLSELMLEQEKLYAKKNIRKKSV